MPGHVYGACAQLADACVGARCALIGAWGSSKAAPARLYAIPSPHRFAFQSLAHVNDPRSYAAVARPHPKWGESPCAFVQLKPGATVSEDEILAHCRANMAGYKMPRTIVFGPLPTTATGKIQKFVLRDRARALTVET